MPEPASFVAQLELAPGKLDHEVPVAVKDGKGIGRLHGKGLDSLAFMRLLKLEPF